MRKLIIVGIAIIITSFATFSLAFDVGDDGKEGLPEAIHALQVVAGVIPHGDATVDDVLAGKIFSNSNATGLEGERPPAPVERTMQLNTYREGDDGYHQQGVSWPYPRFSAGTNVVTDNLTGLMWQRSLNPSDTMDWSEAIIHCNFLTIVEGSPYGILYEDWRLPNRPELMSLIDFGNKNSGEVVLPSGHPFVGVHTHISYFTSTTQAGSSGGGAWLVWFGLGDSYPTTKSSDLLTWCVRGGN